LLVTHVQTAGGTHMNIKWLGHSCFILTSSAGNTLLIDPYDIDAYPDTLLYDEIVFSANVAMASHGHADHANMEAVGGTPMLVTTAVPREVEGFCIRGVATFHDTEAGAQRGDNIVFIITVDGINICHLGDLGHELTPEQVAEIGQVDVLLIPVGGTYTIDALTATRVWQQLTPPLAIPMHFRNAKCLLPIDDVEPFLTGKKDVDVLEVSEMELTEDNLPASPKIVALEPAN